MGSAAPLFTDTLPVQPEVDPLPVPPEIDPLAVANFCTDEQTGPAGFMETMASPSCGVLLRTYFWPAEQAKGVVVVVHGHGSYVIHEFLRSTGVGTPSVYEGSWVQEMNNRGFSVCGLDQQGHGFSASIRGMRCYFNRFKDLSTDITAFARATKERMLPGFSNLPLFIMGESMGGGLATYMMHTQPGLFQGAVLLAPMLSLERISRKGVNPYIRPISSLLSLAAPTLQLVETDKSPINPEVQMVWDNDPLTYTEATRVRVATEYLSTTEYLCREMPNMDFPFLCFHSERDTMCDPSGSKRLYQASKSSDKTLRLVNDMWHALVKEVDNERVVAIAIDWMEARV